jgi:ribonuclease E
MSKSMLINAIHAEESRVAIVENGILEELGIETAASERHKGNIYKASVVRIEPSLQVAFVEYGEKKNGFLPFREIHPSYYKSGVAPRGRARIQNVIEKGLEVLVQVVREEREQKGAYMTTYLSIPGRFLVVIPGSKSGGISRKIEDDEQRNEMKKILKELKPPEGIGVIIRTAGLGMPKTLLSRELKFLLKVWDQILQNAERQETPSLVYRESDLVTRSVRDYFTTDIKEVLIDHPEVYKKTMLLFKQIMPRYRNRIKYYQGAKPIFTKHNLEEQIERIYERKVPLKSGGSIVIERTEALVSIDVNSGKSMRAKGVEETAFRTNMEAAEEIARQVRLRDLGGLIVIDFIDMLNKKHQQDLVKSLKAFLKNDKAKTDVSSLSRFGLLAVSRQRIQAPVEEGTYVACEQCSGTGRVRSLESIALTILRTIQMHIAKGEIAMVKGEVSRKLADYLLNQKREELIRMEKMHKVQISLYGKPALYHHLYHLDFVQRKQEETAAVPPTHVETPEPKSETDNNGAQAKSTARRKKKPQHKAVTQ